jgi:hypothetical protein
MVFCAVAVSSCSYKSIHNDNWVYFEDWDMNDNLRIDSAEFVSGYLRDDVFEREKAKTASVEETAKSSFETCDENKDGLVSSLEFYHWEVNL